MLFSGANDGAFAEGKHKGKLSPQVAAALCPLLVVKAKAIEQMRG